MTPRDFAPIVPPATAARIAVVTRRWAAHALVTVYRIGISPMIVALAGPGCRFEPSCSGYARDAIAEHGFIAGGWMAIRRIGRCRPGGGWGYDPVKPRRTALRRSTSKESDATSTSGSA